MARGAITIRMPPALHDLLAEQAAQQGVSLNSLMVALLAGGTGFKLPQAWDK
jgi:predicted HicB family RNase H-like nuclease